MRTIAADALMAQMPLLTPRLRLRPLRAGDADAVALLMGDWDVAKQTGDLPWPYTPAAARDWISREVGLLARRSGCAFAIEDRFDREFMGAVSVRLLPGGFVRTRGELGYWIARAHWGQGVATEAVRAALDWFEATYAPRHVDAQVFQDNEGSIAVLRKLGFRCARTFRSTFPDRGGVRRVGVFRRRVRTIRSRRMV